MSEFDLDSDTGNKDWTLSKRDGRTFFETKGKITMDEEVAKQIIVALECLVLGDYEKYIKDR